MKELLLDTVYLFLFAGAAAFFLSTSFYLYPIIINVSRAKGLMDAPGERKMHSAQTPTLGGLGVFIAFSLSIIVFGLITDLIAADLTKLLALLGSAIILVFLGIKDDLVSMSPKKKFMGQLLAVGNVVLLTDVRIIGFEGLLGVGELPYVASVLFTVFVFVLVINALNLIDGIDGLAGTISVVASLAFGVLFLLNGDYLMTLVSSILVGSVIGFLRYNLSNDKKIFMGDCGSLLTGFLLAYQGVCFLNINADVASYNTVLAAPIILLAILSYPLFDLLRVFAIRIKQGRSPFSADSNHIHHRLLRLGLPHKKATLFLGVANTLVILVAFLLSGLEIHIHLVLTVLFGGLLYMLPFFPFFENLFHGTSVKRRTETMTPTPLLITETIKRPRPKKSNATMGTMPLALNGTKIVALEKAAKGPADMDLGKKRIQNMNDLRRKMKNRKDPRASENMVEK